MDDPRSRRITELCRTDPQLVAARPISEVTAAIRRPDLPLVSLVATIMEAYADRPALGERAKDLVTDPATGRTVIKLRPSFNTISYRELWARAGAVAAEWHRHPRFPLRPGDFVCTLGFTSLGQTTADLATLRLGAVTVPLQLGTQADNLIPIVRETQPRIFVVSLRQLNTAVDCALATTSVGRLVVTDYHPEVDDEREIFEAAAERLSRSGRPITLDSMATVLEHGRTLPEAPLFEADPAEDRLSLLIYTSGSTGTPKGALYTDRLAAGLWTGFYPRDWDLPYIGINYFPMSHVGGRCMLATGLAAGGTSYFTAQSDLSTLFEDIRLVRPTELSLVPRIADMVHQRYLSELDRREAGGRRREEIEEEVKKDLRENFLGGRLMYIFTGSAPMSTELVALLESCADLPLHDIYAATETGGVVLADHRIVRPHVLDYKLVDVPELGYFTTDKPHPRGELAVKTRATIPGYYKRPELTAEIFDAEGYYRTGDIMAQVGPDELVYVDRRKNALKLSQGEFVEVSQLEAVYGASPLIRHILVHGDSRRPYLLAVVVPTEDALNRVNGDIDALRPMLHQSVRELAKKAGLQPYEIPREFIVETEPFSLENGLLSDVGKLVRPKITERYREALEALYAELAERELDELRALRRSSGHLQQPVVDIVVRAAQAVLGTTGSVNADAYFTDLGGDSMSALSFATLLKEIFDVDVQVGTVISPSTDLRRLAEHIETLLRATRGRPTYATVHGTEPTHVRAEDLTLDRFLDADTLARASTLPVFDGTPRVVLLTGANGYLGRFLTLEWLERLAPRGGTLICLVRGRDAAQARQRLVAAFDSADPELSKRFRALSEHALEVLPGDISAPELGLDERTWQRLADDVDLIVHTAALVNHVLPYEQVFGPNVLGTAEIIRLALTSRLKPVNYLSSVGVVLGHASAADEDADIRVTSPARKLNDEYGNGYATSKWAGEVLLREAHDLCGLPVTVFRSNMILAHSRYRGQLNVPDLFTRLLLSIITTKIAPRSFYGTSTGNHRPRAHYDGLPVDFTAAAVAALGERHTSGYSTFNVVNPHDDGVSLDVIVDWLDKAGHPITRIDDYQEWLTRLQAALRALPQPRQRQSLLPVLHAFSEPGSVVANGTGVPADRFRAAVRESGLGVDGDIPHITAELIRKYATDLAALSLL